MHFIKMQRKHEFRGVIYGVWIYDFPLPIAISHRRGTQRTHFSSEPLFIQKCKSFEFGGGNLYAFAWILRHQKGCDGQKREDFIIFWRFFMVFAWFAYSYALEGVQRHLGGKWCGSERVFVAKEGFIPYKGKPRSKGWFLNMWRGIMQRNESLCTWEIV